MTRDCREAFRFPRANLGFASVATLTLGLGIAVNTTMFSVLYGVLLPPNSTPWMVLFPASVDKWIDDGMLERVTWQGRVGADGSFTFRNVRPGQFLLAALPAETAIDLQDPAFVRRIAAVATPVTIRRGANRAPALKVLVIK